MHIFLLFLKIIGSIIAGIFGLLLIVLFSVLFIPVRYRINAVKRPKEYRAGAKITWFLHLISMEFYYDTEGPGGILKIAGFIWKRFGSAQKMHDVSSRENKEIVTQSKSENEINAEVKIKSEIPAKSEEPLLSEDQSKSKEPSKKEIHQTEENSSVQITAKPVSGAKEVQSVSNEPDNSSEQSTALQDEKPHEGFSLKSRLQKLLNRVMKVVQRVFSFVSSIPDRIFALFWAVSDALEGQTNKLEDVITHISVRFEKVFRTINQYLTDTNKRAGALVYRRAMILLRHYRIRQIKGYLNYGTGSPDLTAKIGGLIYLFLPAGTKKFRLTPDFYEPVLETDLTFSGHIRICHGLWMIIRLVLYKDIRSLIRQILRRNK